MKKYLFIWTLFLSPIWAQAQMSNNGTLISVKSGAMMSVHEEVVNYNGGEFHNTDTIYLFDDWTNNAGNEAFVSLGIGVVHLYGADQRIQGTDITRFYDLRLQQTGVKYGDIDIYVDGFLRLNDRQFHMDTNCISVFNAQPIAVENIGEGYVSALVGGGLMRNLESTQPYFYPVGWENRYRPLELTMSSGNLNQMKVRMALGDATDEGFNRNERESELCEVIPTFSYRIHQKSGTDSARVKIHYDSTIDGLWTTIGHFQNMPEWENTGTQDAGVDANSGLDYLNTIIYNTNFSEPAFALATRSETLALFADDTTVCEGETAIFTAEAGYLNYEFFVNGISVQTGTSNTYTAGMLEAGDIITYQAMDADCSYRSTEIAMIIAPLPIAAASSNTAVCENTTLELFATGGMNYEWEGPNGFTSSNQNPILDHVSLLANGTYTVTVTNADGCTATASTDVVILSAPTATASSNSPICLNEDVSLSATGGISYEWEGPNAYSSSEPNPILTNPSLLYNGTYTVTVTGNNGCTSSASTTIIIHDLPTATASNNSPVCYAANVQLSSNGGISYTWSHDNGFSSTEQNPVLENVEEMDSGIYTVTITDGNGCTSTANTEVIIFPEILEVASNNSPVCLGETVYLQVTGNPDWTYEWFSASNGGFTSTEQNPSFDAAEIYDSGTYTVTVTDGNACVGIFSTVVLVSDFPVVETTATSPVCEFANVQINTTNDENWDYEWYGPNNFMDTISNPLLETVTEAHEGYYEVTVTNATGCESYDTIFVEIHDDLMAMSYGDTLIQENESAAIGMSDGIEFTWNPSESLDCSDCQEVIATPEETTNYQVIIMDEYGCLDTFSILVQVKEADGLVVPNAITPNGDGKNDTWVIPWLDQFPNNSIVILNRWGNEVFFDKPYENNFDGKFNGKELPPGTYYYILLLGEDSKPFKGPLTIIRE